MQFCSSRCYWRDPASGILQPYCVQLPRGKIYIAFGSSDFFVWWRKERVSFLFVFVKYQTPQPKPKKWWHRRYQTAALVAAYPLDKARLGKTCQKQWVKTKKTWQRQKTRIKDRKRRGIFAKTGHCVHLKTKDHKRIPLGYFKRKTILAFFVDHHITSTE